MNATTTESRTAAKRLQSRCLAVRTVAVTVRAARRRVVLDSAVSAEEREGLERSWRAWAHEALARYAGEARAISAEGPAAHAESLPAETADALRAFEAELAAAYRSLEEPPA